MKARLWLLGGFGPGALAMTSARERRGQRRAAALTRGATRPDGWQQTRAAAATAAAGSRRAEAGEAHTPRQRPATHACVQPALEPRPPTACGRRAAQSGPADRSAASPAPCVRAHAGSPSARDGAQASTRALLPCVTDTGSARGRPVGRLQNVQCQAGTTSGAGCWPVPPSPAGTADPRLGERAHTGHTHGLSGLGQRSPRRDTPCPQQQRRGCASRSPQPTPTVGRRPKEHAQERGRLRKARLPDSLRSPGTSSQVSSVSLLTCPRPVRASQGEAPGDRRTGRCPH